MTQYVKTWWYFILCVVCAISIAWIEYPWNQRGGLAMLCALGFLVSVSWAIVLLEQILKSLYKGK